MMELTVHGGTSFGVFSDGTGTQPARRDPGGRENRHAPPPPRWVHHQLVRRFRPQSIARNRGQRDAFERRCLAQQGQRSGPRHDAGLLRCPRAGRGSSTRSPVSRSDASACGAVGPLHPGRARRAPPTAKGSVPRHSAAALALLGRLLGSSVGPAIRRHVGNARQTQRGDRRLHDRSGFDLRPVAPAQILGDPDLAQAAIRARGLAPFLAFGLRALQHADPGMKEHVAGLELADRRGNDVGRQLALRTLRQIDAALDVSPGGPDLGVLRQRRRCRSGDASA